MNSIIAYIGSYTRPMAHVHGQGDGLYTVELCQATGALSLIDSPIEATNSSYLCQNNTGDRLYAINEIYDYQGTEDGSLNVFSIEDGRLALLQALSSNGMGPAYIRIDHSGRWLFCANYVQGNIVVYPVQTDGTLGEAVQSIALKGSGPNVERQEGPHPHAILPSPDNRFVYVIDLGTDWITTYHFDAKSGKLTHDSKLDLFAGAGSGPRHFIFHPEDGYAYFVQELTSQISTCRWDSGTGQLKVIQTHSTLPEEFNGISHCSELRISTDGRHVYVANRGHDSIAHFNVGTDGQLQHHAHTHCQGKIPRNISLSPDGQFLLIANQETNQLVSLRRDVSTGKLQFTAETLDIPTPAYIEFQKS